jgi:hypothetical protein
MRRTLNHWNRLTLSKRKEKKRKGPNRHDGTRIGQMACFWKSKVGLNVDHSTAPSGKKKNISVGYVTSCEWQHNGGSCVKECYFAAMFRHWHWPLRGNSLCLLLMKSHLVWRKFLRLWYITDVTVLNICEGYRIFWLRLFALFQYSIVVSSCGRFTASSKTSSPRSEILRPPPLLFLFQIPISSLIQGHLRVIASYVFLLVFSFLPFLFQYRAVDCSSYPICDQSR